MKLNKNGRIIPEVSDIYIKKDGTVIFADLTKNLKGTLKKLGEEIKSDV
jgi:hypothetical protein